MEQALVLVATFQATPDTRVELLARLSEMVALTSAEPGCLRYDLHVDREDDTRFVFVETWATVGDWDRHMQTDHVLALLRDVPMLTTSGVQLTRLNPV